MVTAFLQQATGFKASLWPFAPPPPESMVYVCTVTPRPRLPEPVLLHVYAAPWGPPGLRAPRLP